MKGKPVKGKLAAGPKRGPGKPGKAASLGRPRSIKNDIRSVERLLRKPDLDLKMRARQEAKLAELRAAQAEHERKERERKYAVRYHKIRFFERVKLERQLRRLEAQLAEAGAQGNEGGTAYALQQQVQQLTQDLQYVKHFPKGEKYVSLLREADTPEAQAVLEAERARLRALVERQLAEAAMLAEADEGAGLAGQTAGASPKAVRHASAVVGAAAVDEEEDDFFLDSDEEAEEARPAEPAAYSKERQGGSAPVADPRQKRKRAQASEEDADATSEEASSTAEDGSGSDEEGSDSRAEGGAEEQGQQRRQAGPPHQQDASRPAAKRKPWQQEQQRRQQGRPQQRPQPAGRQAESRQAAVERQLPSGSRPVQPSEGKQHAARVRGAGKPSPKQQAAAGGTKSKVPSNKQAPVDGKQPLRTRAEGGRKRRKKRQ